MDGTPPGEERAAPPPFGARLGPLLDRHEERGWTARRLADELHVDRSLIYKWRRGERVPALGSRYVERIGALLGLDDDERKLLAAAQVEALRTRAGGRAAPRTSKGARVSVGSLVGRTPRPDPLAAPQAIPRPRARRGGVPPREGAIRGRAATLDALLGLLDGAPDPPTPGEDAILLSTQGEGPLREGEEEEYADPWRQALRGALKRGWRIVHLWRLHRDPRRSIALVAGMLDLLGVVGYSPYYLTPYGTLMAPYDLAIVPGHAALQLYATDDARTPDAALATSDAGGVAVLGAHFAQLMKQARPLLTSYLPARRVDFNRVFVDAEERHGGRVFVKYGLSLFTEPAAWSREDSHWARRMAYAGDHLPAFIEFRARRLAAFERNVRSFAYRDICPMAAVERMAREGLYLRHSPELPQRPASPAVRVEHLENAIRVLGAHDNYQLALVPESQAQEAPVPPETFWEVVGGTQAMINARTIDAGERVTDVDIVIAEPTISGAFQHYFDDLWERIAPAWREKEAVLGWLGQQLQVARSADG